MDVCGLYDRLSSHYDVEEWWPAESSWEVMVGAILVQQTVWENVAKVLQAMKHDGVLSVQAMAEMPVQELESVIRSTGFYRQKARHIQGLARYLMDRYDGDPQGILGKELGEARQELLSLPGIGSETADAILLFAGSRPKFIAAAYVSRVLRRTGILDSDDYGEVQRYMEERVLPDPKLYARFYALLVHHARTVCRTKPRCQACVLREECSFTG